MADDEDLIESEESSPLKARFRRRAGLLIPPAVGRRVLSGTVVTALSLGLIGGFWLGHAPGDEQDSADLASVELAPAPDGSYLPIIPLGVPLQQSVAVLYVESGTLTVQDLAGLGENALSVARGLVTDSGLAGLCDVSGPPIPVTVPREPVPGTVLSFGYVAFLLPGISLTERVVPYLDELTASAQLTGMVEVARSCQSSGDLAVLTDGVAAGIGDEYAVFTVVGPDPSSTEIETKIVVLVRAGTQVIEISLAPAGRTDVPDGLARALRIAELAVTSMLDR